MDCQLGAGALVEAETGWLDYITLALVGRSSVLTVKHANLDSSSPLVLDRDTLLEHSQTRCGLTQRHRHNPKTSVYEISPCVCEFILEDFESAQQVDALSEDTRLM